MSVESKSAFSCYSLNWNLENVSKEKERCIIPIQRAIRRYLASQQLQGGDAAAMIPCMEQWKEQGIARFPRTPLYPCVPSSDKADVVVKSELPNVAAHARKFLGASALKSIDFQSFVKTFQSSLTETLKFMMSLPPQDRGYVIVVDELEKSNSWMVSLALKLLSNHPPIDVVHKDDLSSVLRNKQIRHIVLLDDASYSGKQISSTLDLQILPLIEKCNHIKAVHLVIPYLTNQAKDKISDSISSYADLSPIFGQTVFLSPHEKMAMIGELPFSNIGISNDDLKCFVEFLKSKYGIDPDDAQLLTLTCFDHKIADNLSTPDVVIKAITGDVVPPYKREYDAVVDQFALSCPQQMRVDLIPKIGQALNEQFAVIQKSGKIYVCPKIECEELRVARNEKAVLLKPLEMFELLPGDILLCPQAKLVFDGQKIALL